MPKCPLILCKILLKGLTQVTEGTNHQWDWIFFDLTITLLTIIVLSDTVIILYLTETGISQSKMVADYKWEVCLLFFTYGRSLLCQRLVCSYQTNEIVTLCCPTSTPRLHESSKRWVFHYFCTLLWIWVCLSMPAFVSRERRAWDDSLSLNNINWRCEMISDSACCLCSVLCIYQLSQHLITSTLLLSGVCNKEGRKELREGEGERERAEEGCFSGVWRQHHTTHLWRWFPGDQLWMSGANWIGCSNKFTSSSFFGKRMTMEFALLHHFPPTTPPYNSRLCFPSFPFCSISPGSRCGAERVLVVPTDKR